MVADQLNIVDQN